ncbi:unnamed protein product, partial [marine sediment metagenome]
MALDSGVLPEALTNTVAREDFNDAMAQLDAAFPLTKFNLDGDAVVTIKIKDLNVTTAKIALLAITAGLLGPQAVETAKIKLLNVTAALLGPQAVETAKIKLLNVTEGTLGNLAVSAAKLKADSVETLKIKDLNVTTAKAALGFGRYVVRDATAFDKNIGDFTTDGTWKVNGLDLSAIVPAGATAVHLLVYVLDDAANSILEIRRNVTQDFN